jgi:hypothetical protein
MAGTMWTFRLIELLSMAERTAMPVTDDTEALSAAAGYRVISADLAAGPSVSVVIPAMMKPATCRAEDVLLTGSQTCCGEIVAMLDADRSSDGASLLVPR